MTATMTTTALRDPATPGLLDAAEHLLNCLLFAFWRPGDLAAQPGVWQWRKLDFLDWLRPLEKLLRRIVLAEAFHLALSQTLPNTPPRTGQGAPPSPTRSSRPPLDPDHPESWRVSFRVLGREPNPRRRLSPRRQPPDPHLPVQPRFRRVLHDPRPLACRLEAAMRVMANPAPFIRRVAFRLRRATRASLALPLFSPDRGRPMVSDALSLARERGCAMSAAFFNSS